MNKRVRSKTSSAAHFFVRLLDANYFIFTLKKKLPGVLPPSTFGVTVNFTLPPEGSATDISTLSAEKPSSVPCERIIALVPSISNTFLRFASDAPSPTETPSTEASHIDSSTHETKHYLNEVIFLRR